MSAVADYPITLESPFTTLPELLALNARHRPDHPAVIQGPHHLSYAELDAQVDRAAAALQRDGLQPGEAIAICAANSAPYVVLFLAALRAGMVVAPLAPSSTAASLVTMVKDSAARLLFVDQPVAEALEPVAGQLETPLLHLDDSQPATGFNAWLADTPPAPVELTPETLFNVIYSSGTTGEPKGIVHDHRMRWAHIQRGIAFGYGPECVTLMSTPLYSNTTLVSFLPTIGLGGTLVLMSKFDAKTYLELAEQHRATHTMLVPVQYQRIMSRDDFDRYDLSSFQMKFSTSAPFHGELKADVLARWPGGLVEFYGMTEGGGSCMLLAHQFPDKLDTVGRPLDGHDMRVIDEDGNELPHGEIGEVVGHSVAMMSGYLNKPEKTAEAEWYDHTGKRFIRTGDVGRFDEEGFLTLMDRRKDMIISGGFNIYPSDLEAILRQHPDLQEVTVIGVPSTSWGETPVGYGVLKPGADTPAEQILQWFNGQVGKTQRLNRLILTDELPRSAIGKVLKRELRDQFHGEFGTLD
ncbi:AMP-dependent synthetase and ligase [Pseudomonas saudimassiliensis]|uniref:AMP-dependent synthetase and ligase n=1 Tax=Pseudomonas saudimassiliensis TaxID=1461581 RepID=A0A078M778_9PSED|nr:class I adenylate-forming enzyme family protein [Pseudomonas saudimassiliensis]CEA01197.1 AMP-dependent synthetase and ligase [Pseudomonas saudimassiliensis]CEF25431.1 AMP-dependent synthetase and ligase [Pseudomonas saudimassiliensis]